jgi:hypothetical protein
MSTSIDIIPVETTEITFGQVVEISERNINDFLNSIGLTHRVKLKINIHDNHEKYVNNIQLSDKFEWKDNEYAWFAIEGIAGGTDAYCQKISGSDIEPENPWWRLELMELNNRTIDNIKEKLEKSKLLDKCWSFRRSAGQSAMIALSYGLISASVAELTKGILISEDGAWDYQRFPAESIDFLNWYFRPDQALNIDYADYASDCITGMEEELASRNSVLPKRPWIKTTSLVFFIAHCFMLTYIYATWYKYFRNLSADGGEMGDGVFSIALLLATIYYLRFTIWIYKIYRSESLDTAGLQLGCIFLFSIVPTIILLFKIYY